MKEPKDLKLKIVTEEQKFWTDVKETTEGEIKRLEKLLKFNKAVVEMANNFICNIEKKENI